MTNIREAAMGYYAAIDRSDVELVLLMFADQAVYDRAGVAYRDAQAIRKFFCEERQVTGKHDIDDLWSDDTSRTVITAGRFEGQDIAGKVIAFGFCDIWRFDTAGRVLKRQSFLAPG
jgi:hypothetical protein